jgi:hypothetical protein
MFVPMIFLCFLNVLDPMLYLFLLFQKTFFPVLLKNVRLHDSLFKKLVLQEQFFDNLVAEAEGTSTVIEILLRHDVARGFCT